MVDNLVPNQGPLKSDDLLRFPASATPLGNAPFCDVCGYLTARDGAGGYKCNNCGNAMEEGGAIQPAACPSDFFYFHGANGEKIRVERTTDGLAFSALSGKDDPKLEQELNFLDAWIAFARSCGLEVETKSLDFRGTERSDRMRIKFCVPASCSRLQKLSREIEKMLEMVRSLGTA